MQLLEKQDKVRTVIARTKRSYCTVFADKATCRFGVCKIAKLSRLGVHYQPNLIIIRNAILGQSFFVVVCFLFFVLFFFSQSWFKNRRFKWRKDAREGSEQSPQTLPVAPPCLPFMYQPPYVYSCGPVPVPPPQCQGCLKGQPTGESCIYAADFPVHPYYPC